MKKVMLPREFLERELECDDHNISQACLLPQTKRVITYTNKTIKDMYRQEERIKNVTR